MRIEELSVGDWIATESAQLAIEGNDIATAFVDKVKKPIQIVSVLGAEQLVFGRIEELDGFTTIYLKAEHIEPIPLTPEILEKNGISKTYESDEYAVYKGEGFNVIEYYTELWEFERHRNRLMIRNVHQLQNALRLAGVGKEIEV